MTLGVNFCERNVFMDNGNVTNGRFFDLVFVKGGVDSLFARFDRDSETYKTFYAETGGPRAFAEALLPPDDPAIIDTFVELFNIALKSRQILDDLPRIPGGRGPDKAPRVRRTRAELQAAKDRINQRQTTPPPSTKTRAVYAPRAN
jgi:hypothetical protein